MFQEAFVEAFLLLIGGDFALYHIILFSIFLSFVSVCMGGFIGTIFAVLVDAASPFWQKVGRSFFNAGMAVPTVVIGLVLYGIFSRKGLLGSWGILYTPTAIVIGQLFLVVPVMSTMLLTSFSANDNRLKETLVTLGARRWSYLRLMINESRVAILMAFLGSFARVVGEVGVAMMLGGNIKGFTRTMTTHIALETSKGEFASSLAVGMVLTAIALLINFIVHFALGSSTKEAML